MNRLAVLLQSEACETLLFALTHTLWQALLIAAGLWLFLRTRRTNHPDIISLTEQLRRRMHIPRRVKVAVSDRISIPGAVGVIWPALLLPASMVTAIPADDLRAILAHEFAHIKRCDYLVNFLQMIGEAVLFFNPALWWISRQIRIEREACCDAAAVSATNQPITYAKVLTAFAARLSDAAVSPPAAAIVGFAGYDQSGSLLDRVKRIVVEGHRPRLKVSWHMAVMMLILRSIRPALSTAVS